MGSITGGQGDHAHIILVLCEYIWNASVVSLVLQAFDDTGSLSFPTHRVVYPLVLSWMTTSCFLAVSREADL